MIENKLPVEKGESRKISRRTFLERVVFILGGLVSMAVGLPLAGFVLKPIFRALPPVWRPVGDVDSFQIGETVAVTYLQAPSLPWAGVTGKTAAWLRRESGDQFTAFSLSCTHLGCPVRWRPEAKLFMCPCHGGVYYQDGSVAAGPPPHPLPRYPVRVKDGQVEILAGV